MNNPKEIIIRSMSDQGWTCEYHEPDPGCTVCRRAHTRTATEILRALTDFGYHLFRHDDAPRKWWCKPTALLWPTRYCPGPHRDLHRYCGWVRVIEEDTQ